MNAEPFRPLRLDSNENPSLGCISAWHLDYVIVPLYGRTYNVLRHYRNGFWANLNKSKASKYSWCTAEFYLYPSTTLVECQLCGKLSTPKKITCRNDVYRWNANDKNDRETKGKDILCTGCWNKVRALVKRQAMCNESRKLIAKLKMETNKWEKLQQ